MEESIDYFFILIFLLLSAFFSGSETAFFSLSKIHVKKLEKAKAPSLRRIFRLLKNPHKLLITILLGNTMVNVAASSLATLIAVRIGQSFVEANDFANLNLILLIEIPIMTVILLIFGEISPKLFSITRAEKFASISGFFIEILMYILWPIIKILQLISSLFSKHPTESENRNHDLTTEDFHNLIVSDNSIHPLEEDEKQIIDSIFRFSTKEATEIMIPRVDMVAIKNSDSKAEIIDRINVSGHSRIPVYKNSIDNIIGFIYAKDLILNPDTQSMTQLIRKPLFVPGNIKIQTLLNQFKTRKTHIAIIVDEYGGTSGLITLEDILEELVGEIVDEYDKEQPQITKLNENEYLLSGMYSISDLNHKFHLDIDEESHDNLASFLYNEFNKVPNKNEEINFKNRATFIVTNIKGQRIHNVKMKLTHDIEAV